MRQKNQFHTAFCFLKKTLYLAKASDLQLDFTIFRQPPNQHTIETNCLKLYTIDPEIYSILNFQIRAGLPDSETQNNTGIQDKQPRKWTKQGILERKRTMSVKIVEKYSSHQSASQQAIITKKDQNRTLH